MMPARHPSNSIQYLRPAAHLRRPPAGPLNATARQDFPPCGAGGNRGR